MNVLLLSDDLPGHFNQSLGIIKALRKDREVDATRVSVKLRFGLGRNLMRTYLNRFPAQPAVSRLSWFYRCELPGRRSFNLIVSAGGRTSFANAWLARALRIPNIYAGSLRNLDPRLFTRVLTLEPISAADNNLVLPIHASPVDAADVEREGVRLREERGWEDQRIWLILIGGNGAGYRYVEHDWQELARLMTLLASQHGIRWLVASSRRTGAEAERRLQSSMDAAYVVASSWATADNAFELPAFLGVAERVFVTEDSMTMLTEAIYSRRPVHSLAPAHARPDERYQRTMQRFADRGFICRHSIAALLQRPVSLDKKTCRPMQESPIEQLAKQLHL